MSSLVWRGVYARDKLHAEQGRAPTTAELAQATELTEAEVDNLLRMTGDDRSLSDTVGEEGSLELGDTLEQDSVPGVELELMKTSFARHVQSMVDGLDEKEREVLRLRFGLDGDEPRTLQEIGDSLGLSRERIRQIESKAKEKLRRSNRAQGLRGALN